MLPIQLSASVPSVTRELFDSIDTVIIACDGVLWCNDVVIHNVIDLLCFFKGLKKKILYLENNTIRTKEELLQKFQRLIFPITEDEILRNLQTPVEYLKDNIEGKVYVIGGTEIIRELREANIPYCVSGPNSYEYDSDIKAVLVENNQPLNSSKLIDAKKHLANVNTVLIGYYTSKRVPLPPGSETQGTMLEYLEMCTKREPVRLEKSKPYIPKAIDPSRTLVISDRVTPKSNPNIMFGKQGTFKTLLVFSGVTPINELFNWKFSTARVDHDLIPDYCVNSLREIYHQLTQST